MAMELVFQFVYPFFIILTLVWFITSSLDEMMIVFFFLVFMGTFRGFFGFLRTGQPRFLHYGIYVFLYILCLIPSKLWAILTLWNNDWGTSARLQRLGNYIKAIHAIVWSIGFVIYITVYFLIYMIQGQKITPVTLYGALGALGYIIFLMIHWRIWGYMVLIPQD
jgi:hyaluronan synthase